jgi:flagellar basal body-associated protein FliL
MPKKNVSNQEAKKAKKYSESLGYVLLFMGVGILLFVVILTWFFVSGTFEAPTFGSVTRIDSFNLDPLVSLILVIVMLLIATSIGKFFVGTGYAHIKKKSE